VADFIVILRKSLVTSVMSNNPQPSKDTFAAHQQLLRERLLHLLTTLHPALRDDVTYVLESEGRLLSQSYSNIGSPPPTLSAGSWPLLTLLVAQHISPDINPLHASSVAVAVECFVCAIDLLDDVMDEDQTTTLQVLGVARTLNVSTALLTLAQQSILSLGQQGAASALVLRLLETLQESALVVAAGQHRDVLAEQRPVQEFTREECIEIAAAKASSIMRLACRLGTLCAGANDTLYEQFSNLGELLGIAHQLDNDSHDLYYLLQGNTSSLAPTETKTSTGHVKSDLARGKKTLPIVLGAQMYNDALQKSSLQADQEKEEYLRSLYEGIITTWGICLLYRERARDRLQEIEAQKPVTPVLRLLLGFE
jgi:geranylgeranyl pyrophosphate synthase